MEKSRRFPSITSLRFCTCATSRLQCPISHGCALIDALTAREKNLSIEDFVRLIRERGVDFEMTAKDEVAFTKAGAAPQIFSAPQNRKISIPSIRSRKVTCFPGITIERCRCW